MNTEHPTELNTNTRLALLRDACHNRDAERVAPLLVDASDLCWDYACKHGMAPVDWAEVDRKVYSYIPATHHTATCATCQGQGARIDPAGIPSVHQDACPDCFDGLRRAPTPPLWVQRSCVSRADWIAHVGSFPEVYLLWSTLHRPASASTTTATVLDPDGFPVTLADPEALYPPAEVEPFTYCNAVSRSARWPREVWCYEVEPGLVVPDSWAFMVWGLQGPVSVVWRVDGLGFRLPTHHEWRVCSELRTPEGGWGSGAGLHGMEAQGFELCWSRQPWMSPLRLSMVQRASQDNQAPLQIAPYRPNPDTPGHERFVSRLRVVRVAPFR